MITGEDVRQIREFLGMSRDSFAERIGCSPQFIYLAESGRRGVSIALRKSLRRVVNGEEFRALEKRLANLKAELEAEA